MRIFPVALVVIGLLGVARYFGLIPVGMFPLIGPLVLIALGVALLLRRPRHCRGAWRARHGDRGSVDTKPPSAGLA